MICPKCHKDWWLKVVNGDSLVCSCGYREYAPETPEPSRLEIRLAYPADRENVSHMAPALCGCGKEFTPRNGSQKQCTACANDRKRTQRAEANRRWRQKSREQRQAANG